MDNSQIDDIINLRKAISRKNEDEKKKAIERSDEKIAAARPRKVYVPYIAALLMIALLLYGIRQVPLIVSQMAPPVPLRYGTYNTDKGGNACITGLWEAAAGKQGGVCPVSSAPYIKEGEDTCCPNPERHGLKSLCYRSKIIKVVADDGHESLLF